LRAAIVSEGRFPFLSNDAQQDIASRNLRAARFWDDRRFSAAVALFQSIRKHVESLDADSSNPASFFAVQIDAVTVASE
jgi:hypothetical protein